MKLSEIARQAIQLSTRPPADNDCEPRPNVAVETGSGLSEGFDEPDPQQEFVEGLPPYIVYCLLALICIGQGATDPSDPLAAIEYVRGALPRYFFAARKLAANAHLAYFLQTGLDVLAAEGIDIDAVIGDLPDVKGVVSTSS